MRDPTYKESLLGWIVLHTVCVLFIFGIVVTHFIDSWCQLFKPDGDPE